jgi:hypothetical protein
MKDFTYAETLNEEFHDNPSIRLGLDYALGIVHY